MKSLLITGSNGLLGSKLVFAANGRYRIVGLDVQPESYVKSVPMDYVQGDIQDRERLHRQIEAARPDCIIHTAAFTDVDGCESQYETAYAVNVGGTEHVASACRRLGIKAILLSTDYVFDGKKGPYTEDDEPNPLSAYGKMKWESEKLVRNWLPDAVIVRTMVLFGFLAHVRKNFVVWLIEKLQNRNGVRIVNDQYGTPTLADDLAEALMVLLEKDAQGLYHAAGKDCLSRFAFALRIAEVFGLNPSLIEETTSDQFKQPAPRPMKSGLRTDKLERDTGFRFRSLDETLKELKKQMQPVRCKNT